MKTFRAIVLAAWVLANASAASAQGAEVAVSVDPCVPIDHAQLERLLAIELGTSGAKGWPHASAQVWVSCSPLGIELRLEDSITRKSMWRTLPASSFRDASSTRLLALAIAEFVVASWVELSVQPRPVVEPVGPPPSPAARHVAQRAVLRRGIAPSSSRQATLSLAFSAQLWTSSDAAFVGGTLRFVQMALPQVAWMLAADFNTASVDLSIGSLRVVTGSAALGAAFKVDLGDAALYLGPGGRIGFARMLGQPSNPDLELGRQAYAPFSGVMLWSRAEYQTASALRLALDIEGGVITLPVRALAAKTEVYSLSGVWLSVSLALAVAF